jgi:hypothetical protein
MNGLPGYDAGNSRRLLNTDEPEEREEQDPDDARERGQDEAFDFADLEDWQ